MGSIIETQKKKCLDYEGDTKEEDNLLTKWKNVHGSEVHCESTTNHTNSKQLKGFNLV